jgi:lipopolysaccharide/colanic/teichoic acid biosynthesis glycosyltransferase/glycosyltransferase involved in cell wall biosynthesis
MKKTDDGTLSLFGDDPAPSAAPATTPEPAPKKPRAKRQIKLKVADQEVPPVAPAVTEVAPETPPEPSPALSLPALAAQIAAQTPTTEVPETVEHTPVPRRNTPWAAALQAQTAQAHVMLVITRGEIGGAQSHVLALCEGLRTRVKFSVVIGEAVNSALSQKLRALDIEVFELPSLTESLLPWRLWPALKQLIALIQAQSPDIVHAHSAIAGLLGRLAANATDRPVVYTVHGFAFKPQAPWLHRHLARWAEQRVAQLTTHMICVSKHERELALDLPMDATRIHTIPNGISSLPAVEPQTVSPETSEANAKLPRIVMVARMNAPKRQDLLLRAAALVRDALSYELPLTFIGSGPLLKQHQSLGDELGLEQVTWLGDIDNVAQYLKPQDIFVLLSDHEGMPITVIEAMRAGMPILASDLPGIREQILHNQEGLLCHNTPESVSESLLQLVRDPYVGRRLGRAAQLHFEQAFSAERMANRVWDVYQLCLQEDEPQASASLSTSLVSAAMQRRDALQSWTLWGAWLLLPSLMLAQLLQDSGLMTYQFGQTIGWCVVPYIVAAQLLMRNSHLPVAERSGVLWVSTLAPFALTPLGFALLQQPYSRAAVVWAYAVTTLWLWWGYRRKVASRALRLAYFDTQVPQQLRSLLLPHALSDTHLELLSWQPHGKQTLPACDGLVIDAAASASDDRTRLLSQLKMQHLRLYSVESVAELLSGRTMLPTAQNSLWEIDNDPGYDRFKRLIDLTCVLLLAPVWLFVGLLVALIVKFDSPGPVLFVQTRVGRNGRNFNLYKFRSMVHGLQAPGVDFARADDPRITRVGRFIRRTRLDELPQLVNVLLGQMSLIGPRPEQVPFVREFATTIPSYPYRHLVRPGLTGWAQVQQGYADSADTTRIKLSYDLYYVEHYSLALDLLIAAKTLKIVFTGFGAR